MATSGQINTNVEYESYFWVKWAQSGEQEIANNRTKIAWSCGLYSEHRFYNNAIKMSSVTINGVKVFGGGTYSNFTAEGDQTIASGTLWIDHDANGAKTFTISAFTGWLYSDHNYSSNGGSYSLTTIPRQAVITASANFTDLDNPSISFSNPGGFAMDVWLEPNPVGDHLCVRKNIPNTGSYTWVLTDAEREALRSKCTSGTSCTIRLGLYSYIGGTTYSDYHDRTYTIVENDAMRPSVYIHPYVHDDGLPSVFKDLYIQGKTRLDILIYSTPKDGASITGVSTTVDGKTYTNSIFVTDVLTKAGTLDIVSTAKDSRGFVGTATKQIVVVPYAAPWITSFSVERQADGTTVTAHLKGGISPVENKNTKAFRITLNGVTKEISATAYNVDDTVTFTDVPTDATLTAEAKITDAFTTITKNAMVPTVGVTMDFHSSGTGVAFGKVAEHEKVLDVAWDIKYKGGILNDFVVEQGVDGSWAYRKWNNGKAEAWLTSEFSFTATPSALLGGYYAATSIGLPGGVFGQSPTCIAMGRIGTGIGFASVGSTTSTSVSVSVFGNQNGATSYITALYATGQWK